MLSLTNHRRLAAASPAVVLAVLAIGVTLPSGAGGAQPPPGAGGTPRPMIGALQDFAAEKFERFSCSVYFAGRRNAEVLYERGETGRAYMNIHGKNLVGQRLESSERSPMKVGERYYIRYRFGAIEVRLDGRVTTACPAPARSCELMKFTGTLTAIEGARKETHDVYGACGA